jgi:hypothetical protein
MSDVSILYDDQSPVAEDGILSELLDDLYSLLDNVNDPVKLKVSITSLIHRIEDRIAGDLDEGAAEWDLTSSYTPQFSLLIQQAQQQNQQ